MGVDGIDAGQVLGSDDSVLVRPGQAGADAQKNYLIARLHQRGEEVRKLLGANSSGPGQGLILGIALEDHLLGKVHTIQIGVLSQQDVKGGSFYVKTLQQLRGQVASAVAGDKDRFTHWYSSFPHSHILYGLFSQGYPIIGRNLKFPALSL